MRQGISSRRVFFFCSSHKNGKKDASVVLMILKRRDEGESNGRVQEHDPGILNW